MLRRWRGKHEGRIDDGDDGTLITTLKGCQDALRAFESNARAHNDPDAARHYLLAREHVVNAIERVQQGLAESEGETDGS